MTWAEFRQWALEALGFRVDLYPPFGVGPAWRAVWGDGDTYPFQSARTETGSGFPAVYGPIQQRRLALWIRARGIVDKDAISKWLAFGEVFDDGWLINDGTGIRWVADPESEALDLVKRGFVAVKCGI